MSSSKSKTTWNRTCYKKNDGAERLGNQHSRFKTKNGKLPVCLDPKDLNKVIKRCYPKTLTLEEITYKFVGSRFYSKLDAKNGYWSVVLDEESDKLTTFSSPFGRYCFLRMPFGLVMSQNVFQHRIFRSLKSVPVRQHCRRYRNYRCVWENGGRA